MTPYSCPNIDQFLADLLLHIIIGYWHHLVVRPSVCLSVTVCIVAHWLSRPVGYVGLKVVPACSYS